MPNSSGGLELIDFLVDAVAAEEESLHDIECACSAVLPSPARGEVEEDVH